MVRGLAQRWPQRCLYVASYIIASRAKLHDDKGILPSLGIRDSFPDIWVTC